MKIEEFLNLVTVKSDGNIDQIDQADIIQNHNDEVEFTIAQQSNISNKKISMHHHGQKRNGFVNGQRKSSKKKTKKLPKSNI